MKRIIGKGLLILIFALSALNVSGQQKAKYVFYFIGDGMGFSHVCLAEYYSAYNAGQFGSMPVSFSNFPVFGTAVTHSDSNYITDSAAAGTALSTGSKTKNGMLSVSSDGKELTSISYKIHNAGFKVGITSTVGLNHATPAAFYANSDNRNNYYDIALQLKESGFEFFAGGGIIDYKGKKENKTSVYNSIEEGGYDIYEGLDDFHKRRGEKKALLLQDNGKTRTEFPYAIDMESKDMTQSDLIDAAVGFLYDENTENGFFIMSEGGKIDWASHANDTKAMIYEVLSFSDAVSKALEFYNNHPDETLIVVTADHETGGLALGYESGYNIFFDKLAPVKSSKDKMSDNQKEKADDATENAHIGWTSHSHTGINVPVYAIGTGSELFSGRMDNTDIPKNICKAMGVAF